MAQLPRPYHHMHAAGQELLWWPTDTQARCEEMMQSPEHREYFRRQGWLEPNGITYCFNQHGFRDCSTQAEFSPSDNNLIALGCSFTMGIGLAWHQTWPALVGAALGLRVCNFGWGGGSADRCFRLAEYWVPYLKPKLVVLLNPPRGRIEIVTDPETGEAHDMLPSDTGIDTGFKRWLLADENQRLNNLKNSLAIEAICRRHGIEFLSYEADTWMSRSRELAGYARDHFHAGPVGHRNFTENILDDWRQKQS